MAMILYNTMGREKEEFKPISDKKVGMYACGPTVYFFPHIGNLRAYVAEDLLRRLLVYNGYQVKHVMNITDVGHLVSDANVGEDKLRLESEKENKSMVEIANFYTAIFIRDLQRLNILMPDIMCKASMHIEDILNLINILDKKGYLYKASDGIYYDTSKFKDYGKLSGSSYEELNKSLKAGARVERPEGIKSITDFVVWRFAKGTEKEMIWDSPYGVGFPGWHIECSAMSMKYLGNHFDIHCGGIDHIPVHHTNEIAQSEAATGDKFVNYWFHVAFLSVNGQKMSKSLKNIYTLDDLINKGYNPLAYRYFLITGHYRQGINFTFEALENASNTLQKIYTTANSLFSIADSSKPADPAYIEKILKLKSGFFEAMNNDLDTPTALFYFHSIINEGNRLLNSEKDPAHAALVLNAILEIDDAILGIGIRTAALSSSEALDKEAEALIQEREKLRKEKRFAEADKIRELLKEKYKIILEDTPEGLKWHKIY
ncbi:MAG: cysteine--tRNA ligase [Candidatus Micrarchaeia archaeon]